MLLVLRQHLRAQCRPRDIQEILLELLLVPPVVDRTFSERLESSRRRDTVSIDNGLRVDFLVNEFLGFAQKLGSKDGDGGGAITNFIVLNFRNVDEHFGRRVVESYGFEDCGAVIGHRDLPGRAVCRDSSLGRFRIARGVPGDIRCLYGYAR